MDADARHGFRGRLQNLFNAFLPSLRTDLDEAFEKGLLSKKLNPVMACYFLEKELLTPVLKDLIVRSSLPLRSVETTFAPDSTGFSTSRFVRWFDEKYGAQRSGRDWVKVHAITGTKTHVVTSVEILEREAGDSPQFGPLVKKTAENFTVKEVVADKAYLSRENLELVASLGAKAYVPFKSNRHRGKPGACGRRLTFTTTCTAKILKSIITSAAWLRLLFQWSRRSLATLN